MSLTGFRKIIFAQKRFSKNKPSKSFSFAVTARSHLRKTAVNFILSACLCDKEIFNDWLQAKTEGKGDIVLSAMATEGTLRSPWVLRRPHPDSIITHCTPWTTTRSSSTCRNNGFCSNTSLARWAKPWISSCSAHNHNAQKQGLDHTFDCNRIKNAFFLDEQWRKEYIMMTQPT